MTKKVTTAVIREMKEKKEPISMITAYDCAMSKNVNEAGIDMILVGDSLGNVVLGYSSTIPVTMEDMIHHTKAVVRGNSRAMVVGDMPFMSYQKSPEEALANAGRFMKEGGCDAVKLEGGKSVCEAVRRMTEAGIPVVGHLGLTPQSVHQLGGYKVQGKEQEKAQQILNDAKALEEAGAFAIVLECVPAALAERITDALNHAATIGIGAGCGCDGQVLVCNDLLGVSDGFRPKFVRTYADLHTEITGAVRAYIRDVKARTFPADEHTFAIEESVLEKLY